MERNIIIAGVGGQGILSIAYVITQAALEERMNVKQSEVHGMAQRGGAVQSHLRISTEKIASDLIPKGTCDLLIGVEPLEAARYMEFLSPDGAIVTSRNPVRNIDNYPEPDAIWKEIGRAKKVVALDAEQLAKEAGSSQAQNTVILGAASPFLGLKEASIEKHLSDLWQKKGPRVVETNLKAFRIGRQAALRGG